MAIDDEKLESVQLAVQQISAYVAGESRELSETVADSDIFHLFMSVVPVEINGDFNIKFLMGLNIEQLKFTPNANLIVDNEFLCRNDIFSDLVFKRLFEMFESHCIYASVFVRFIEHLKPRLCQLPLTYCVISRVVPMIALCGDYHIFTSDTTIVEFITKQAIPLKYLDGVFNPIHADRFMELVEQLDIKIIFPDNVTTKEQAVNYITQKKCDPLATTSVLLSYSNIDFRIDNSRYNDPFSIALVEMVENYVSNMNNTDWIDDKIESKEVNDQQSNCQTVFHNNRNPSNSLRKTNTDAKITKELVKFSDIVNLDRVMGDSTLKEEDQIII